MSGWAIRIKAYRAAFAALDVLPEFDVFGVGLHSPEMILSFTMVNREDMVGYDDGRIDLVEFCRRCAANGELVWESRIRFPWLRQKWRLYSGNAKSHWAEYRSRRTSEEWSEDRARFELIDVVDCSSDELKARTAAAALDALPGKAKQLEFPDLAERLVKAVDRGRVRLTARDPKAAHRRGRCDRVWVRVFTRRVRPRDADGVSADPYLLTVEYSASSEFQKRGLIDHEVYEFEKYRVSIKKLKS